MKVQINLLPEEFRAQVSSGREIPYVKIAIVSGVLFALLTVFFYIDYLASSARLNDLRTDWELVQPEAKTLNELKSEVEGTLQQEKDFMRRFVTTDQALTHLMTWASEYLPETSWLTELKLELKEGQGQYLLRGLTFASKERSSIQYIEAYLHDLKEQMPEAELNLTTTRQVIDEKELTQFTAIFTWGKEA